MYIHVKLSFTGKLCERNERSEWSEVKSLQIEQLVNNSVKIYILYIYIYIEREIYLPISATICPTSGTPPSGGV